MKTVYFNVPGSPVGGGPSVFVYKTSEALKKRGYKVLYDKPGRADAALCIIETGKTLKKINRDKTKVIVRIDGIFNNLYNKKFNRAIRPDMTALHSKLKSDIPSVDHVVYQSSWSKEQVDKEIIKRADNNWSIINNGVDVKLFKPLDLSKPGELGLFHIGKMRNGYIMECLIGCFKELKKRGHNVRLSIVGSMDAECSAVFKQNPDPMIKHLGSVSNTKAVNAFGLGDIYLGPRQGSSCDNVIAEAQACGLPVIVPSWGGNKDMVVDNSTGVVVDSGQWDYDAQYIQNMADAAEKIAKDLDGYSKRAREHAVKNLNIDKMVDKYIEVLDL